MIFDVDKTEHEGMYELVEPKSGAKAELKVWAGVTGFRMMDYT